MSDVSSGTGTPHNDPESIITWIVSSEEQAAEIREKRENIEGMKRQVENYLYKDLVFSNRLEEILLSRDNFIRRFGGVAMNRKPERANVRFPENQENFAIV